MTRAARIISADFDPGRAVPEIYDVFCEACGYSLLGLSGDRCPECGKPYDPTELPFARIPWLHRRRLGRIRAYCQTVRMVCFSPTAFAAELCRPVRISADDARRFRRVTIRIATVAAALVIAALFWANAGFAPSRASAARLTATAGVAALCVLAFYFLLRLATDMPLFIWKGLPSLPAHELAPVHHYASAPLAAAIVLAPLFGFLVYVQQTRATRMPTVEYWARFHELLGVEVTLVVLWMAWIWIVALLLMRTASQAAPARVVMLAAYLPLHWLMMSFMMLMLLAVAIMGAVGVLSLIWPWIRY